MGVVVEMQAFRRTSPKSDGDRRVGEDHALFTEIRGRCPGCRARRSFLVAFDDQGTDAGTCTFYRILPHFSCDGEHVIEQEMPDVPTIG